MACRLGQRRFNIGGKQRRSELDWINSIAAAPKAESRAGRPISRHLLQLADLTRQYQSD